MWAFVAGSSFLLIKNECVVSHSHIGEVTKTIVVLAGSWYCRCSNSCSCLVVLVVSVLLLALVDVAAVLLPLVIAAGLMALVVI